ncbi:MAG: DUF4369 domain-containing protein [Alistipes sp.]|nr:DUF4369 domain-containing protein [Alistipes sp.]
MRVILAIVALFAVSCSSNTGRYIIEGTTFNQGYYYLSDGHRVVDSALIVDGRYRFEGEVDSLVPIRYLASTSLRNPMEIARVTQVILESGTISVSEDDDSPTGGLIVSGTDGNDALRQFTYDGMKLRAEMRDTRDMKDREAVMKRYDALVAKVISKNSSNYAGTLLLSISKDRFSNEQRAKFYKKLSPAMKKTLAAQQVYEQLNK